MLHFRANLIHDANCHLQGGMAGQFNVHRRRQLGGIRGCETGAPQLTRCAGVSATLSNATEKAFVVLSPLLFSCER